MEFTTPPPAHSPMAMDSITALGNLTGSTSYSQGSDMEGRDMDWTGHSEDEMSPDSQCRPSIETDDVSDLEDTDDGTSLRGGVRHHPQYRTMARRLAVDSWREERNQEEWNPEDEVDNQEEWNRGDEIDIEYPLHQEDPDEDDTSSDWDSYGDLPHTMSIYEATLAQLEGSEDWNADQKKLHKLIYMRGLHPMMPSWWRVSFKMWGVTQPHLDDVFTPMHSKKRVVIHAYGNEVAAAKALESLFYLSQTVTDYEEIGYQNKIAPAVVKCIRAYIKWAMRDAGIDKQKTMLNLVVQSYPPDFQGDDESDTSDLSDLSDLTPSSSPVSEAHEGEPVNASRAVTDAEGEQRRVERFTQAVSRDVEKRLLQMGQGWRAVFRKASGKGFVYPPPTLYAFAVIQHIVLLASHDPASSTNPVIVLEQVHLNDRSQWLWNALSLALPINMARDALNDMRSTGIIRDLEKDVGTDPDM